MTKKRKPTPKKKAPTDYSRQKARLEKVRLAMLCRKLEGTLDPSMVVSVLRAWQDVCKTAKRVGADDVEVRENKEARENADHPWAVFLGGHNTRIRPTRLGLYLICDLEGNFRGTRYVDPDVRDMRVWEGWWHSVPLPGMPKTVEGVEP